MKLKVQGKSEYDGRQSYEVVYEGEKHFVNLYKFQEGEMLPQELDCNIKQLGDGKVSIVQNIIPFLEERYTLGETYEFIVRNDFSHSGYYELADKDGFYFRLDALPGLVLYIGQEVECRVIDMQGINISLELLSVDDAQGATEGNAGKVVKSAQINEESLVEYIRSGCFDNEECQWDLPQLIRLVFLNEELYGAMVNSYILNCIKELRERMSYEEIISVLKEMRDSVLYVLEETDCLSVCEVNQRKVLQSRLSVIGVTIKNYVKVAGYFAKGQVDEKVNRLLHNLKVSGYVFQAEKQLGVMMLIFSLDNEKMESQMSTLLKIIHGKDVKYWKDEPFRTAFIKLLELYISHKKEQLDLAIHDEENVKRILEALSIQLLLSKSKDDSDIFDFNLNRAMFYRYASYLKTSTPKLALGKAFLSLMDVNQAPQEYAWNDTMSHGLLASKLSSDLQKTVGQSYTKVYKEGDVKLEMSDNGIVLQSLQVPENKLKDALPANLLPWNNLQVRLQSTMPAINLLKKPDLKVYQQLWNLVERDLYDHTQAKVVKRVVKKRPVKGESYGIRVLYKDELNRLVCRIAEDGYEGEGYLYAKEIVPYNINMHPSLFKNRETGKCYVFDAKVVNIDHEDKCQFTIQPLLNETLRDETSYTNRIPCLITGQNENGYLGVNAHGASVHFNNSEEFPNLRCNDMLYATDWEQSGNSCYKATILTTDEVETHVFTIEDAFNRLMDNASFEEYTELAENANSEVLQQEDLMDRTRVKELMSLIDRLASLESEYLVTYNYLGFAKMLARLVDDKQRYEFYSGWMNLIAILHHFAVNSAVPSKDLDEFEHSSRQLFSTHSEIYKKYLQLKIASLKGKPEYNTDLWEFSRYDDEVIKGLAECVLAYNLLGSRSDEVMRQRIDERVAGFMQIKDHSSKLHDFGLEDLHTEFKTSLVYPSNNNMQPNLPKQTHEILKEVSAMLNAEGGHLYIGVNDCGVGVGMNSDLSCAEFNGSIDKYDVYFRNQVCLKFGRNVDAYVKTQSKDYAGRMIYQIEIKPCQQPVRLEGIIYERHGSSKVAMEGENDRLFCERRQEFYDQLMQRSNPLYGNRNQTASTDACSQLPNRATNTLGDFFQAAKIDASGENFVGTTSDTIDSNEILAQASLNLQSSTETDLTKTIKVRNEDLIHSSKLRPDTPLSYEDNPTVVRYIQFFYNSYKMVSKYYGPEDGESLTLAIHDGDEDKYLVLAYEDGKACKIPVANLLDKEDYQTNARYSDKRLMFAEIASDDDLLMSICTRKHGVECLRFDTISKLAYKETMTSVAEQVCTVPYEKYIQFDIVPAAHKVTFRDNTDLNCKQPGKSLIRSTTDKFYNKLSKLGLL